MQSILIVLGSCVVDLLGSRQHAPVRRRAKKTRNNVPSPLIRYDGGLTTSNKARPLISHCPFWNKRPFYTAEITANKARLAKHTGSAFI